MPSESNTANAKTTLNLKKVPIEELCSLTANKWEVRRVEGTKTRLALYLFTPEDEKWVKFIPSQTPNQMWSTVASMCMAAVQGKHKQTVWTRGVLRGRDMEDDEIARVVQANMREQRIPPLPKGAREYTQDDRSLVTTKETP